MPPVSGRQYFSERTGSLPQKMTASTLKDLLLAVFDDFEERGYWQEAMGFRCIDRGDVPGTLGTDIERRMRLALRKANLWPLHANIKRYKEDDLFDVIEFLHDHVSKPLPSDDHSDYHSYSNCGWHYQRFDTDSGQQEYRGAVNPILRDFRQGFELTSAGEILELPDEGLENLLTNDLPAIDPQNVEGRIQQAILKFRRFRSSSDDKKEAVRELADVLEYLRPQVVDVLSSKDESDLFNLANNFGIRHHNSQQKTNYDQALWLPWMFYYYLATIHVVVRMIKRHEAGQGQPADNHE